MCLSPKVSTPAAPAAVAQEDPGIVAAKESERRRQAMAKGQESTMLTGGMGAASTATAGKSLLGQ